MNVFEAVKENVTAREAAENYGIEVRRNGMACCPFHSVAASSISLAPPYTAELAHSAASPLPTKPTVLREPF